jgi:hypothetical protein
VADEERGAEEKLGWEKCVMWPGQRRKDRGVWQAGATRGAVEERGPNAGKGADMAARRRTSREAGENRGSGLVGGYGPVDVGLAQRTVPFLFI